MQSPNPTMPKHEDILLRGRRRRVREDDCDLGGGPQIQEVERSGVQAARDGVEGGVGHLER